MSTPIRPPVGSSGVAQPLTTERYAASVPSAGRFERWLTSRIQRRISPAAVRLELWDGTCSYDGSTPPLGTLVIGDRRALIGLALHPDLHFGESYMAGRLEVRGPLEPVVEALTRLSQPRMTWRDRLALTIPKSGGESVSPRICSTKTAPA